MRLEAGSAGRASALSVGALVFVIVAGHLSLAPKVADLDSFYHLGHAAAYGEGSIFDTSLPWATQSVIADYEADLWWGFHVVLLPFTAFGDVADGIRVAAVVLTLVLGLSMILIFRRHGVSGAGWWALLFMIAVPNVFYRYLMVRPHVLSLLVTLLLLSFLARGRWWQVGIASAAITWLHVGLFWMAPGVFAAYALVRATRWVVALQPSAPDESVPIPAAAVAVVVGSAAGWLLRPRPLATAMLGNVQIIRLFAEKSTEEPLLFSAELAPLPPVELVQTSWSLLLAWLVAGCAAAAFALRGRLHRMPGEERTLLATALLVSVAFLGLTVWSARRAQVEWVAFGFLALPLLWSHALASPERRRVATWALVVLVIHLPWAVRRHWLNVEYAAFPGNALAEAATWLAANSAPDDVVFHARWDNFGPLFARNRVNRYLGGMDPIFQFAHDPRLYWEHFWLSSDIHDAWTCDAFPCPAGVATDTHEVLSTHFGARWVLVEPRRNPRLSRYFRNDPRFELALETQREAVFRVLDATRRAGDPPGSGDANLSPARDTIG